jgi:hypothetical protein
MKCYSNMVISFTTTNLKLMKKFCSDFFKKSNANIYIPAYRIIEIKENKENNYEAVVQIIGTAQTLKMKPEEILESDDETNKFSPADVRTLTYLGYLGINSPKYKILARRLTEKENKVVFALHKKGNKKIEIKNANEISQNQDIIGQLRKEDILTVGYTAGSEMMLEEQKTKDRIKQIEEQKAKLEKE